MSRRDNSAQPVAVTGMGVVTVIGASLPSFEASLRSGRSGVAAVPRGWPPTAAALLDGFAFDAALEAHARTMPERFSRLARKLGRRSSLGIQAAIIAALDAWSDAGLEPGSATDTGIVVAGSNLGIGHIPGRVASCAGSSSNITPRFCVEMFDTDHVGVLSELLGLRGEGLSIGGACASGNVAIRHGLRRARAGEGPTLVIGAMMDLSSDELRSFQSAGALVELEHGESATGSCRPFDRARRGFVYGQGVACLVLEPLERARVRGAAIWGLIAGASSVLEGTREPTPFSAGQVRAMRAALADAGLEPGDIDYVNAHATGSRAGDAVELQSLAEVFAAPSRRRAWINSTKALVGHTVTAAGVIEAVATLLQMAGGFVHANPFLRDPLEPGPGLELVGRELREVSIQRALSNSFGFAGISSSLVIVKNTSCK